MRWRVWGIVQPLTVAATRVKERIIRVVVIVVTLPPLVIVPVVALERFEPLPLDLGASVLVEDAHAVGETSRTLCREGRERAAVGSAAVGSAAKSEA